MPYRTPARYLAPLALLGVLALLFAAYTASFGSDDPASPPAAESTTPQETSTSEGGEEASGEEGGGDEGGEEDEPGRTYTVEPGDILSAIAEEEGVTVERIVELNPDIDPQGLQTGDELILAP